MNRNAPAASTRPSLPFRHALTWAALTLGMAPAAPAPVLCDGSWEMVADTAASPPSRYRARLAYDEERERVVLFGGRGNPSNATLGDTWEWDGSSWSLVADTGPAPRAEEGLAYDRVRQRIVMFGGQSETYSDFNDTWEWDGVAWQQTTDPGKVPAVRHGHGMAYGPGNKMVLFGGSLNLDKLLGDTWRRDGTDWKKRNVAGPDPQMVNGAMAFEHERDATVLVEAYCARGLVQSTWEWNGVIWQGVAGAQPSPRTWPTLAYDSARHRVVLYGGDRCPGNPPGYPIDTWEFDGTTWQQVATGGGPGRRSFGPSMTYDRARGRIVLFGSANGGNDTTWAWDGPTYRCDNPVPGDINCDGVVDNDDGRIIDAAHGKKSCAADDTRDLDGDGRITTADKKMLVSMCTFADCKRR